MKIFRVCFIMFIVCFFPTVAKAAVFTCSGKAIGSSIYSVTGFAPVDDGLSGGDFKVVITETEMVFLDNNEPMKTISITENSISVFAKIKVPFGDALMLYTFDRKNKVMYISAHKDMIEINGSGAGVYLSKCY